MNKNLLRRSLLYIPGSSSKMLGKARDMKCDGVILDLEDSVSIGEKGTARHAVAQLLPTLSGQGKEVLVRVNAMDSVWGFKDLFAVVPALPNAIVLPKADETSLVTMDMLLTAIERDSKIEYGAIKIIALLETAYSVANSYQVLGASKRINGVQLGAEDLTKEQEISRTSEGSEIQFARQQLAMAARAHGIDIIDTPFTGIVDLEGLRKDSATAKSVGFTGKTCIHPRHIEIINEVFSPTQEEVESARALLAAYNRALNEGRGACMHENKMIDAPVAQRAERVMEKAARIGGYN